MLLFLSKTKPFAKVAVHIVNIMNKTMWARRIDVTAFFKFLLDLNCKHGD